MRRKMEIYADYYTDLRAQRLRVKCHYCGLERSVFVPFDIGTLPLNAAADIAFSLME
nr:MAG TPA: PriA DNA helicase Cys-rich region (CRR) domain [Caudoviricetes sp.]